MPVQETATEMQPVKEEAPEDKSCEVSEFSAGFLETEDQTTEGQQALGHLDAGAENEGGSAENERSAQAYNEELALDNRDWMQLREAEIAEMLLEEEDEKVHQNLQRVLQEEEKAAAQDEQEAGELA